MSTLTMAASTRVDWARSGGVLFAFAAFWSIVTAAVAGVPVLTSASWYVAAGLVLAASWFVATRRPMLLMGAVVAVAVGLVVRHPSILFDGGTPGPLGYANATAAFFGLAIVSALILVAGAGSRAVRGGAAVVAVALVPAIVASRSWAVAILLPAIVVAVIVITRARGPRAAVSTCAALFIGALVITQLIGAGVVGGGSGPVGAVLRSALSVDRVLLWQEAMTIMAEDPVLGVGPGNFASASEFARADADRSWTHNEFLQAGAESGLIGYVLAVALVLWGFTALWTAARDVPTALAAAGLAIVGVQATIDYLLHFPAVSLTLAIVVGSGIGAATSSRGAPGSEGAP